MSLEELIAMVEAGTVSRAWVDDGGVGGYLAIGPLVSPFFTSVSETQLPEVVQQLRGSGIFIDTTWEVRRLRELAAAAQTRGRYYGLDGGDVRTYAQRLAVLQPESAEATSLLRKVGEHMAWDATAALDEGPEGRAAELVRECLALVPDHPRCLAVPLDS
jgi:hypothetical protein